MKKNAIFSLYFFALTGLALFGWSFSRGAKKLIVDFIAQKDVIAEIEETQDRLSRGFDLFSKIQRQKLSEKIAVLKKKLQSSFYFSNQSDSEAEIKISFANKTGDEWSIPKSIKRKPDEREIVQIFAEAPLYASDRTIFVDGLPFMFLCTASQFATVNKFRRGGIFFEILEPNVKEFNYNGYTYVVSWVQGQEKAAGVFDFFITKKDENL